MSITFLSRSQTEIKSSRGSGHIEATDRCITPSKIFNETIRLTLSKPGWVYSINLL